MENRKIKTNKPNTFDLFTSGQTNVYSYAYVWAWITRALGVISRFVCLFLFLLHTSIRNQNKNEKKKADCFCINGFAVAVVLYTIESVVYSDKLYIETWFHLLCSIRLNSIWLIVVYSIVFNVYFSLPIVSFQWIDSHIE